MDVIKLTFPKGGKGIRIVADDGAEIEVARTRSGTAIVEIKKYDDEGDATSVGIRLSRKDVRDIVELLETKMHAMKRPEKLYNKETAR